MLSRNQSSAAMFTFYLTVSCTTALDGNWAKENSLKIGERNAR